MERIKIVQSALVASSFSIPRDSSSARFLLLMERRLHSPTADTCGHFSSIASHSAEHVHTCRNDSVEMASQKLLNEESLDHCTM